MIGSDTVYFNRSIDFWTASFTADIAETFARYPREVAIRSTMSSAGLIRGKAT